MSGYGATLHGTEYVLNQDQIKAIRDITGGNPAGAQQGKSIIVQGPIVSISGPLVADRAAFDRFVTDVDTALHRLGRIGY